MYSLEKYTASQFKYVFYFNGDTEETKQNKKHIFKKIYLFIWLFCWLFPELWMSPSVKSFDFSEGLGNRIVSILSAFEWGGGGGGVIVCVYVCVRSEQVYHHHQSWSWLRAHNAFRLFLEPFIYF